jgi:predicted DNA-binding ribbon-helix-helix protein
MCEIFAGQNPADYESATRSVRLNGFSTSLRLEARFWRIVDEIAASQGHTTPKFLSTLHDEVLEKHGEVRNFASLLRTACLIHLDQKAEQSLAVA